MKRKQQGSLAAKPSGRVVLRVTSPEASGSVWRVARGGEKSRPADRIAVVTPKLRLKG